MYNFSQEQTFILFFIIGIVIGMLFDIFRAIRKSFKTSDIMTMFQDIIFMITSGIFVIYSIIILNGGEIRAYLFISIFLGIVIYSLTFSKICVIIFYVFVKTCKNILKIPYNCWKIFFNKTKHIIKKDF